MTVIQLRNVLSLVAALAIGIPFAHGQKFFFDGTDYVHYVPNVPGTANGRLYIGEITGDSPCHYRVDVPAGKTLVDLKLGVRNARAQDAFYGVATFVNGSGSLFSFDGNSEVFQLVDSHGQPCPESTLTAARVRESVAAVPSSIRVSNDADSHALSCDGRYAVVVGANSATPVSLVDFVAGAEVDTFAADSNVTFAQTFDDGESVVVVANIPPQNVTNRLRRLKIVNGRLVDTSESLAAVAQGFADYRFQKVFAVPGSKVGVATAQFGVPQVVTFSIPGLQILDSITSGGDSAAVSCAGDQVWLRNGSQIKGYTLDAVTGALGDTPFLTISDVGQTNAFVTNFGNALAISRDGTRLIVPEGTAFPNSPATPRTTFFDTTTGARLGFFDAFGGGSPTLASTYSCCTELHTPAVSTVLFKKGDSPPGASGGAGNPPVDALLSSFGVPAIDADGKTAFTAKWTSATAGKGSGLFTDTVCVATIGSDVPVVSGATFKTLADPLIDGGHVTFLATLGGVPKSTAGAVLSNAPGGTLAVIARTGDVAPSNDGTKFKSFSAVCLAGKSVGFLATLASAKATDMGLWAIDDTHPLTLLLREGQIIASRTIKTITSFKVGNGSPGQGRGWVLTPAAGTQALALVTFTDKTQAVVTAGIDGTITVLSQGGPGGIGGPDINDTNFASYGMPALNATGHSAFLGSLAIGAGGVTKKNARGVFANFGTTLHTPIARAGGMAGATGATFDTLKDPVLASDDSLAFTATIKGGGIRGRATKTLWAQGPGGATYLAAQGGANPPGTGGAQWNDFTSLAVIPGHGPLFSATLVPGKGGAKPDAAGVWGADVDGVLRLYFLTGQTIDGKKLKSFKLLNATPGSLGATRSFNDTGVIAWLATFTDKTTAIVTTELPASP